MSTNELDGIKLELIDWINQTSDDNLILFLDGLRTSRTQKDWWDELSPNQKKQIIAGLKEAEDDKLMDSNKFWKNLKNG